MSGFWEIEASVSPAREILPGGSEQLLVRVQIVDLDSADPAASSRLVRPEDGAPQISVMAPRGNPPTNASISGMPVDTNSNALRSR